MLKPDSPLRRRIVRATWTAAIISQLLLLTLALAAQVNLHPTASSPPPWVVYGLFALLALAGITMFLSLSFLQSRHRDLFALGMAGWLAGFFNSKGMQQATTDAALVAGAVFDLALQALLLAILLTALRRKLP